MKKLATLLSTLLLVFGFVLAQDDESAETEPMEPALNSAIVSVGEHGFLVDGKGMTLYMFLNDSESESTCFDDCAVNWPPLLAGAELPAGEGIDESLLGQIERPDGSFQVTYAGWPLYYYAGDLAAGDTAGQAVGDVWFAVDAEGNALQQLGTTPDTDDADDADEREQNDGSEDSEDAADDV